MTVLRRVILLGTVVFLYNDVTIRDSIARTANEYVYTLLRRSLPQGAAVYRTDSENEYSRGNTLFWEQRKLGDEAIEILAGGDIDKDKTVENGKYPIYANALTNNGIVGYYNDYYRVKAPAVTVTGRGEVGFAQARMTDFTPVVRLLAIRSNHDCYFLENAINNHKVVVESTGVPQLTVPQLSSYSIFFPKNVEEELKIGEYFHNLDTLITLHQREPPKEDKKILNDINTDTLFYEYYNQWLVIYKEGSVRLVTMHKYYLTAAWIKRLIPTVRLCDFDRITYQQLINDYAELHERQTTMDFHHQLKGAILDAVDDGLIARDPTRKVIIKGKTPNDKKKKYLSRYELQKLLADLDLKSGLNMDWLILLIAKTGMRFSEAIAVTPADFDFTHQTLSVNKTWDYKGEGGFQPTKNRSSVRKIRLDWQTVGQFYAIVRELNENAPFFVSKEKKIYNSTLNDVLERHCKAAGIPVISVHGLRHTHASLLLFDGVSIASVAQRLGHSSINTTQKTYLHIIRELENKDIDLIMKSISSLLD